MSTTHYPFLIRSACRRISPIIRPAIRPSATENSSVCGRISPIMRPSVTESHSVCRKISRIIRPAICHSAAEARSVCRLFALFVRVLALPIACSLALACQRVTLTDEDNPPSSSTPTVTHREEVLLATNDTARFYLSGTEISNIRLNLYPTPSDFIKDPRYRLPTKLEVYCVLNQAAIPSGYWQSRQRILCYDTPRDFGIKIGSAYFGTDMYYTYIPNGTVIRAGMKTKYCILPIRTEQRTQDNSSLHITINDEWEEY